MDKLTIYDDVTNQIIEQLENGVQPLREMWSGSNNMPLNFKSNNNYSGINVVLLKLSEWVNNYESSSWLTYKQAQELEGKVKKGEKSTRVVFYKTLEKENDKGEIDKIPMLRTFNVFNIDQIDGVSDVKQTIYSDFEAIDKAENIIFDSGVTFNTGKSAFYRPSTDEITLPAKNRFKNSKDYYAVALHELTHATGHKSRCDRKKYNDSAKTSYAFEELVAEIGSAFCLSKLNLLNTVNDHASYINSWIHLLKSDNRAIFKAAAQAEKAHKWIFEH